MPSLAGTTMTRVALSMAHSSTTRLSMAKTATIVVRGTLMAMSVRKHFSGLIIRVVFVERLIPSTLRTSAVSASESTFIMIASAFITILTNWWLWFLLIVACWCIIVLLTTSGLRMGSCGILGTVKSLMFGMCWIGTSVADPCLTFYVDFDTIFGLICTHVSRIAVLIGSCNVLTRCVNCLVEDYRILSHLYR